MEKLSIEDVRRVARLSRLKVDETEITQLQQDLEKVLGYMENLSELDGVGVEATSHVLDMLTPLRKDEAGKSLSVADALANAGQVEDGYLIVPRVLDEEGV